MAYVLGNLFGAALCLAFVAFLCGVLWLAWGVLACLARCTRVTLAATSLAMVRAIQALTR